VPDIIDQLFFTKNTAIDVHPVTDQFSLSEKANINTYSSTYEWELQDVGVRRKIVL
jgi:hypothetical protein